MSEARKTATLAQLAAHAPTREIEHELPEGTVVMVFKVPIGEEGAALHNDLEGLKDQKDVVGVIAPWVGKLVDDASDFDSVILQQIVRTVGVKKVLDVLSDCAGLRAQEPDHLSTDRSGGGPATERD